MHGVLRASLRFIRVMITSARRCVQHAIEIVISDVSFQFGCVSPFSRRLARASAMNGVLEVHEHDLLVGDRKMARAERGPTVDFTEKIFVRIGEGVIPLNRPARLRKLCTAKTLVVICRKLPRLFLEVKAQSRAWRSQNKP